MGRQRVNYACVNLPHLTAFPPALPEWQVLGRR